jgi:DNA-directed RNA polymerase subunit alpha
MVMVTPRIEILEDGDTYGKFVAEPLEQGFGYTIGNALRRVLLSSISGAAATSLKVDGVLHEFAVIPGIKEDVTELILNLRELYIKMDEAMGRGGEVYIASIDVTGAGEVTGSDIVAPEGITVANPELHIATLSDETAGLKAELTVERGKGYVLPENQENVKKQIGVIPLGAVFTPVLKVSYNVDPTRVGHKTDLDRLVLEVTTNGTVRPSDAVSDAAKIIDAQLRLFFDFARSPREGYSFFGEAGTGPAAGAPDIRIEELDFSVRTYNCLKKAGLLTIGSLIEYSEGDLMNIRNFGKKSLTEVKEKLAGLGFALKPGDGKSVVTFPGYEDGDDEDEDEDETEAVLSEDEAAEEVAEAETVEDEDEEE